MPKPLWDQRVPFVYGRMALSKDVCKDREGLHWFSNQTFKSTLELQEGFDTGSSSEARRLWFIDIDTGYRYCMFVKELYNALKHSEVKGCRFTGHWTFKKSGGNYSIIAVKEENYETRCYRSR